MASASDASTSPPAAARSAPDVLHGLISQLLERAQRGESGTAPTPEVEQRLTELALAEALLRQLDTLAADRPVQVALLGPTQTGKSTAVNLLCAQAVAQVSPLAGFTIHPQGFWLQAEPADPPATDPTPTLFELEEPPEKTSALAWADGVFPDWRRCELDALSRDDLRCYGLERVVAGGHPLAGRVLWDTPDFDSLASRAYRQGLLAVAAAVDVFVFVLSKEKYSDLSVWRMLSLLAPLRRPLVIVLNKMTDDAEAAVTRSLRERLEQHGVSPSTVTILSWPYDPHLVERDDPPAGLQRLTVEIAQAAAPTPNAVRAGGAVRVVKAHWDAWVAPVVREHEALDAWARLVAEAEAGLLTAYRRDFLDHPQRYDSFRRATAELLALLELPRIGNALGQVRSAVTWPARKLFSSGQRWLEQYRGVRSGPKLPSEQAFLHNEIDTLLMALQRDALRRSEPAQVDAHVWRALERRLTERQPQLRERFRDAARAHHEQVTKEIRTAADKLYNTLQKSPKLLNTLRGARAMTDIAGIALAVKSGGAAPHDLVFAPAMFALTSLLTEGALGTYMQGVAQELKESQYEDARTRLVSEVIHAELIGVGRQLEADGLFGISRDDLAAARDALDQWEPAADG